MAGPLIADRIKETTTTIGTGTLTLLGAEAGFRSFSEFADADTCYYVIAAQTPGEWEVGEGTVGAGGTTLARTRVITSSNANALVNFAAGTKDVLVDRPSELGLGAPGGLDTQFQFNNAGAFGGAEVYYDVANERVGIGIATPNNTLQVAGFLNSDPTLVNLFIGDGAGVAITTGTLNLGLGASALLANQSGHDNTALGINALKANIDGNFNIALGSSALAALTSGDFNSGFGYYALTLSTTPDNNTAYGVVCMEQNTTGGNNTGFGFGSVRNNQVGQFNVGIGTSALQGAVAPAATGQGNVAIGYNALRVYTSAGSNVGVGISVLNALTTGGQNVCLGPNTGQILTTGARNILIGNAVNAPANSTSDYLSIGNTLYGDLATDSLRIGAPTPTARLHLPAGAAGASLAPLKFTSGTLQTTAEAGAVEFLTDAWYATITTGAARKGIVLNDGTAFTDGRIPFATSTGRLTDAAGFSYLSGTTTFYAPYVEVSNTVQTTNLVVTGSTTLATSLTGILQAAAGVVSVAAGVGTKALFDHYASVGNVGTGEDDLYSDTIPAARLAANGEKITATYQGTFTGAAASTQQLKIYFGGTQIYASGTLAIGVATNNWTVTVSVIRESSSVVRCAVSVATDFGTLFPYSAYTRITGLTLTNTQILKLTGEAVGVGAADNQVVATLGYVQWVPAA